MLPRTTLLCVVFRIRTRSFSLVTPLRLSSPEAQRPMRARFKITCLFSIAAMLFATGCLVKETVTVNGEVREDDLKFKRPLKEAIENTEHPQNDY